VEQKGAEEATQLHCATFNKFNAIAIQVKIVETNGVLGQLSKSNLNLVALFISIILFYGTYNLSRSISMHVVIQSEIYRNTTWNIVSSIEQCHGFE
jgi:hypothetical protein